jgi:hypothetical protein
MEVEHFDFEGAGCSMCNRDDSRTHTGLSVQMQTVPVPVVAAAVG